jgi:hypothetical protein
VKRQAARDRVVDHEHRRMKLQIGGRDVRADLQHLIAPTVLGHELRDALVTAERRRSIDLRRLRRSGGAGGRSGSGPWSDDTMPDNASIAPVKSIAVPTSGPAELPSHCVVVTPTAMPAPAIAMPPTKRFPAW